MALFRSQIITDVSGSAGGLTFFRSKGGLAFRSRVVPVNPSTSLQLVVRNAMASVAASWRSLTQSQRDGWDSYATNTPLPGKLGGTTNIGGEAMYCRCNVPRVQAGLSIVSDGPIATGTGDIPGLDLDTFSASSPGGFAPTFDVGAGTLWSNNAGAALLLYVSTGPFSAGISYFDGPWRFLSAILGNTTPPTSGTNIPLPFNLVAGDKLAAYARVTRADGRLTQRFRVIGLAS